MNIKDHTEGFSERQIESIEKVISKIKNISGKICNWNSGSTFWHLAIQLKNLKWIIFHSESGDITISTKFYKEESEIYEAFYEDWENSIKRPFKPNTLNDEKIINKPFRSQWQCFKTLPRFR